MEMRINCRNHTANSDFALRKLGFETIATSPTSGNESSRNSEHKLAYWMVSFGDVLIH
jgi:hypothetical protein